MEGRADVDFLCLDDSRSNYLELFFFEDRFFLGLHSSYNRWEGRAKCRKFPGLAKDSTQQLVNLALETSRVARV